MATRQAAGSGAFAFLRKRVWTRPSFGRGPKIAVAAVLFLGLVFAGVSAWAVRYDNRTIHVLPENTVIGGVNVGGLRYQAAVDKVRGVIEAPLHQPIHVASDG